MVFIVGYPDVAYKPFGSHRRRGLSKLNRLFVNSCIAVAIQIVLLTGLILPV